MGKFLTGLIVVSALVVGGAIYYLQVYAFYRELAPDSPEAVVRLTTLEGRAVPVEVRDYQGIDADSSPIRYRACFRLSLPVDQLSRTYTPYEKAVPLNAPGWFSCFDAKAVGEDLEVGKASAWLGEANITYGVDRVVAVYPDGRAFAWNQLNRCGREVFDGKPAPEGCPPPPERKK